jgi:hypothetical protein
MDVIINPGAGPVLDADTKHAENNMGAFVADVGAEGATFERVPDGDGNGRFAFALRYPTIEFEIDMPGLPLEQVRSDDLLRIPRLYVNGSSWFWGYAVGIVVDHLEDSLATRERQADD